LLAFLPQSGPIIANDWYSIEDALTEWFGPHWSFVQARLMPAYVKTKVGDEEEEVVQV